MGNPFRIHLSLSTIASGTMQPFPPSEYASQQRRSRIVTVAYARTFLLLASCTDQSVLPSFRSTAPHGLPCELIMNGPASLTAWASPFSARSLTSQSRCTSAKASGAFPLLCAAS
jgi:hypothetical protein